MQRKKLKNNIKNIVMPLLASRPATAIANLFFSRGIPLFMLHRMTQASEPGNGETTSRHLRRCLQFLVKNKYNFISLERLVLALRNEESLPPKPVLFTLDDGYVDQADIAVPIFSEFDCPVTFFVITGMLDQTLWPWDAKVSWIMETTGKTSLNTTISGQPVNLNLGNSHERRLAKCLLHNLLREVNAADVPEILRHLASDADVLIPQEAPAAYRPLSWEMARQLEQENVQFAPHSVTHSILSRLNRESLEREIHDSWLTMTNELARPLKIFCYPTGRSIDFGRREIETLKSNGFLGAVTAIPGVYKIEYPPEKHIYSLPRFPLPQSMGEFIQYCSWIEANRGNYLKSDQTSCLARNDARRLRFHDL
jgi:peptidoglycan/xylan/chitin deacetylase (PgdA/CDA1 family)